MTDITPGVTPDTSATASLGDGRPISRSGTYLLILSPFLLVGAMNFHRELTNAAMGVVHLGRAMLSAVGL